MQDKARLLRETMRGVLDLIGAADVQVNAAKTPVDLICMAYVRCCVHLREAASESEAVLLEL